MPRLARHPARAGTRSPLGRMSLRTLRKAPHRPTKYSLRQVPRRPERTGMRSPPNRISRENARRRVNGRAVRRATRILRRTLRPDSPPWPHAGPGVIRAVRAAAVVATSTAACIARVEARARRARRPATRISARALPHKQRRQLHNCLRPRLQPRWSGPPRHRSPSHRPYHRTLRPPLAREAKPLRQPLHCRRRRLRRPPSRSLRRPLFRSPLKVCAMRCRGFW